MLRHLAEGETAGPRVSAGQAPPPEGFGFRSARPRSGRFWFLFVPKVVNPFEATKVTTVCD